MKCPDVLRDLWHLHHITLRSNQSHRKINPGLTDEIIQISKHKSTSLACLDTSRHPSLAQPCYAVVTFGVHFPVTPDPLNLVKRDNPEWTCKGTDAAPDTPPIIHDYRIGIRIPGESSGRADLHTGCRITVSAPVREGKVVIYTLNLNARKRRFFFAKYLK